jgi:hypothetical protein
MHCGVVNIVDKEATQECIHGKEIHKIKTRLKKTVLTKISSAGIWDLNHLPSAVFIISTATYIRR